MCICMVKALDCNIAAEIALATNPVQLKTEWRRILVQLLALISLWVSHYHTGDLWKTDRPYGSINGNTYLHVNGYTSLQAIK
jgi:hypothetical protein